MSSVVAGVSRLVIPRLSVMYGGAYGYTGTWTWLKRPVSWKSCESIGPPV